MAPVQILQNRPGCGFSGQPFSHADLYGRQKGSRHQKLLDILGHPFKDLRREVAKDGIPARWQFQR